MGHYETLGVAPGADAAEVRRAYLRLARTHHPDRTGGDVERMRAVNAAWEVLGDPARRRRYDLERGLHRTIPWTPRGEDPAVPDLDDDEAPVRVTIALPRLLSLLPAALFGGACAVAFAGMLLRTPAVFGLALLLFVLSVLFFVASPFLALYASHRTTGAGRPDRPG